MRVVAVVSGPGRSRAASAITKAAAVVRPAAIADSDSALRIEAK